MFSMDPAPAAVKEADISRPNLRLQIPFISLHMWETICDAWACWSGWKFGANSTEYPYSVIQNTSPPPENWNLARSWDFEYFQLQNTPPPPENWNLSKSWDFEYFQLQNTPPPEKWNLARSWTFEYFQLQNKPPQIKLKFSQIFGGLWVFCNWKYSKSQDLPKFQFSGGGGVFCNWKYSKSQDLPKFQFREGGGIL